MLSESALLVRGGKTMAAFAFASRVHKSSVSTRGVRQASL